MSPHAARRITADAPNDTGQSRVSKVAELPRTRAKDPPSIVETARPYDLGILAATMILAGLGVVMVYSASIGVADMRFDDPNRFLRSHLTHVCLGVTLFVLGMSVNYQLYRRYVYWILGISLLLLMLTVLGLGINRGHSTRWIGPSFFQFQPSELAKLAFVVYLAYSLEKKLERMESFAIGFLPHVLVAVAMVGLCLAQPDLGTSILLGIVMFGMLFVGGTRVSYIVGAGLIAVPLVVGYIARSSQRMDRILTWLDPWADRFDSGFQAVNSLTSLGSGGVFGLGLGEGRQKMGFLTQSWTDFVFSSIGEELGLVGCGLVLLLFTYLCLRGFRAALRAPDRFGRYLAFGITLLIGIQAAFNMGVAVGLLPTKGLNLPLISGGGSSLLITMLGLGILLNVSRWAEAPAGYRPLPLRKRKTPRLAKQAPPGEPRRRKPSERRPISQKSSGVRPFPRPSQGGGS